MTDPAIVRYRGLILTLLLLFAVLTLLAIPTIIALGTWPLAVAASVSLFASLFLYRLVKDYR